MMHTPLSLPQHLTSLHGLLRILLPHSSTREAPSELRSSVGGGTGGSVGLRSDRAHLGVGTGRVAMAEREANGVGAYEGDESIRSSASTDQLMSGELLKPGHEVREGAFPATSGGYGDLELEPAMAHTDEESEPRSEEQGTEAFYDAPVGASDRESVGAYQDGSGAVLMKAGDAVQEPSAGGYGVLSEGVSPADKIRIDDGPLPKPRSNPFAGEESAESYQDSREAELESFDEIELAQNGAPNEANGALFGGNQEKSLGNGAAQAPDGRDFSEPTDVGASVLQFPDAPTGSKTIQRGYGYGQEDTSEHAVESAPEHGVDHPAKKEGFIAKMMEKLPGHHKSAETATQEHDTSTPVELHDTASTSPKKGLMEKIKEKLPGHHGTTE